MGEIEGTSELGMGFDWGRQGEDAIVAAEGSADHEFDGRPCTYKLTCTKLVLVSRHVFETRLRPLK
jgi:hypothetical protein